MQWAYQWKANKALLRKLTWRKLGNGLLLWLSYGISRWMGKPLHWGMPVSISFEPTTACNLRCPECPSGLRAFTRPTGMLLPAFFQSTIDQLSSHLLYLTFYFQGEPYLNPQFLSMVKYAAAKGIFTATSTNGHYLTDEMAKKTVESGLDRLIISIDGVTQSVYEQYRVGGDLEKVIAGTKRIIHWKKQLGSDYPLVIFQFLVVRPNEHQIPAVKQLAQTLGVDAVWFKTAQINDPQQDPHQLIPKNEKYARYRRKPDGTVVLKNKMVNRCWRMWQGNVITWDGAVVPCCFDKDAQHQLGHLQSQSFLDIWRSDKYQQFRMQLHTGRASIDICTNCTEGTKVWERDS